MTEYAIYGIGTTDDEQIVAHLRVGKRDRLERAASDGDAMTSRLRTTAAIATVLAAWVVLLGGGVPWLS